jgi:hypothetical protein
MSDDNEDFVEPLKRDVKKLWKNAQKDRYKQIGGRVFDRWIFTTAMLLTFAWFLFVAWSYDWSIDYYRCGPETPALSFDPAEKCDNPFYKPASWKNQAELWPGEYGTKPGPLFQSVYYAPLVVFALALLLNFKHRKAK